VLFVDVVHLYPAVLGMDQDSLVSIPPHDAGFNYTYRSIVYHPSLSREHGASSYHEQDFVWWKEMGYVLL
jgi:hypothetical protein